jgi:ribonuclease-3 family protein
MENYFQLNMEPGQINAISNLGLAHIGDAVFEVLCRGYLCCRGGKRVDNLHRATVAMVKAPSQAAYVEKLLPYLSEQELAYYRRGKNSHVHSVPKGATPAQYAKATGLETLFGALYLAGQTDRLNELFHIIIEEEPNGI